MKHLDQVVLVLLIIAGINWGLWGFFEFNLIYYIFGREWIDRSIYVIFGFCALYLAVGWKLITDRFAIKTRR